MVKCISKHVYKSKKYFSDFMELVINGAKIPEDENHVIQK